MAPAAQTPVASEETTFHATCVVVGEAGILIRGPSGAGKSRLALEILDAARLRGLHARLVGDDRVRVAHRHGRLVARPHPVLAGRIERRGLGILAVTHQEAAVLRLVIDRDATPPPRLPDAEALDATILRVRLPRLLSFADDGIAAIALERLGGLSVTLVT
ncbi:HPr kinase/phosphatase C-terminal domain-containing protein [Salinarimonas sp.]|uniref:HPr kinase/phosphorylase n=1 Tax=Salinarimonas sp. TaxID=2766526 RepID=UPI0032D8E8B5